MPGRLPTATPLAGTERIAIVAALALLEYARFGIRTGAARVKCEVAAPATTGHPVFERYFRVQQNTIEQLVMFLPGLFRFGPFVRARRLRRAASWEVRARARRWSGRR